MGDGLTAEREAAIRKGVAEHDALVADHWEPKYPEMRTSVADVRDLLAEVDRLRTRAAEVDTQHDMDLTQAIEHSEEGWAEVEQYGLLVDGLRAFRDAAADQHKRCGCVVGARVVTVKHCGGHAIPADAALALLDDPPATPREGVCRGCGGHLLELTPGCEVCAAVPTEAHDDPPATTAAIDWQEGAPDQPGRYRLRWPNGREGLWGGTGEVSTEDIAFWRERPSLRPTAHARVDDPPATVASACTCDVGPTTDGPDRDCPLHGVDASRTERECTDPIPSDVGAVCPACVDGWVFASSTQEGMAAEVCTQCNGGKVT